MKTSVARPSDCLARPELKREMGLWTATAIGDLET